MVLAAAATATTTTKENTLIHLYINHYIFDYALEQLNVAVVKVNIFALIQDSNV